MYSKKNPLFLLLTIIFVLTHWSAQTAAQDVNQAALVIAFGEGNVQSSCIEFTEPEISGYELLQRAGLSIAIDAQGMGAAICSIGGTGCPADDCWCQCTGSDCVYWSYWHQLNGNWQYSQAGAAIYPVTDGAVEGWSWGPGSVTDAIPPPNITFESICAAPATNTPTPTNTPTAVPPTHTPLPPTNTPQPTNTPAPRLNFWADTQSLTLGSCTTLHWDVEFIRAVYLNEQGVEGQGVREVCPTQTATFALRIVHSDGEETLPLTITVILPTATPTATSIPQVPDVVPPSQQPTNTPVPTATHTPPALPTPESQTSIDTTTVSPTSIHTAIPPTPTLIWITAAPAFINTPAPITLVAPTTDATIESPLILPITANPIITPPATTTAVPPPATTNWLSYLAFFTIISFLSITLIIVKPKP